MPISNSEFEELFIFGPGQQQKNISKFFLVYYMVQIEK